MATCRVCMAKIPKGVLRIGHLQDAPQGDSAMTFAAGATRWHHFECFPRMRGAKWMVVNLPSDVTIIDGYDDIEVNDQKVLKTMWEALLSGESETKAGSSSSSTSSSVKKRPAAASSRSEPPSKKGKLSALTSTQGELTIAQFKKVQKLEEALRESTSAQLQAELSKNLQVSAGKKEDLCDESLKVECLGHCHTARSAAKAESTGVALEDGLVVLATTMVALALEEMQLQDEGPEAEEVGEVENRLKMINNPRAAVLAAWQ
eukprot:CAMPEP_0178384026 /NCGR_PEP_ID=MMETSP0689_2-20121128/7303_1 /TAXON_ID=160604 /ORGANISM="Amphidinium massartii, Strain CS-259" /LENGTH=260 /DNA_ID=CAMNT_0020004261 /DNA_START=38 /DNA_END=819 /DNA_ORIENTATION=-